jgi:hypothetical protein
MSTSATPQIAQSTVLSSIKAKRLAELDKFLKKLNTLIIANQDIQNAENAQQIVFNINRWATENLTIFQKFIDMFATNGLQSLDDEVVGLYLTPVNEALKNLFKYTSDALQAQQNHVKILEEIAHIIEITATYHEWMDTDPDRIWYDIIEDPPEHVQSQLNDAALDTKPIYNLLGNMFAIATIKQRAETSKSLIMHLNWMKDYYEIPPRIRMDIINEILADDSFGHGEISGKVLELIRGYQFRSRLLRREDTHGNTVDWMASVNKQGDLDAAVVAKEYIKELASCIGQDMVNTSYTNHGQSFNYCAHATNSGTGSIQFGATKDVRRAGCTTFTFNHRPLNDVLLYFQSWCTLEYKRGDGIYAADTANRLAKLNSYFYAALNVPITNDAKRKAEGFGGPGIIPLCNNGQIDEAKAALGRLIRMLAYTCPESPNPDNLFHRDYMHHVFEEVFPFMSMGEGGGWVRTEQDEDSSSSSSSSGATKDSNPGKPKRSRPNTSSKSHSSSQEDYGGSKKRKGKKTRRRKKTRKRRRRKR